MLSNGIETAPPERLRDEAISSVTKSIRGHLSAERFDEASRMLEDALERYPGDVILEGVGVAIEKARRRQESDEVRPGPSPVVAPSQIASLRSAFSPGPAKPFPLVPVAGLALCILGVGAFMLLRSAGSAGYDSGAPKAQVRPAPSEAPDTTSLQKALTSAIADHAWDEARLWLNRFSQLQPGDPRVRDWLDQIDRGSAVDQKTADLRADAQSAIRARNWSAADKKVGLLLAQVPGDPDGLQWRQMLADGRREDLLAAEKNVRNRQAGALRAEIPQLIQAKRWSEAQRKIADLQQEVPDDPEAAAWQKALTILRIAEMNEPASAPAPSVQASAQIPQPAPARPVPANPAPASPASVSPAPASPAPVAPAPATPAPKPEPTVAVLRKPAVVPAPVESAIPLPSSLTLPTASLPAPPPPAPSRMAPAQDAELTSRISSIVGHWVYLNPKAARPRLMNGFQFAAEAVAVDVYPDGAGSLIYQVKPGIWHVADTTVEFRFRLSDWDGKEFIGMSEDEEKRFSITLEPGKMLNLSWHALKNPGTLHVSEGVAPLTRGRAPGSR